MKIPLEFEITELPDSQSTVESNTETPVDITKDKIPKLQHELHAVISEMIRQRRFLADKLDEEHEEQNRETRAFYLKLLVVVDSMDRLIRMADSQNELANSLNALRAEFLQVLEDQEIMPINVAIGEIFDKEICEATSRKLRPDLPAYSIISIERRGYTWKSRLLRRVRIIVSAL